MSHRFFTAVTLLFTLVILALTTSCRKSDTIDTTPGLQLSFSTDTVYFDSVFTTVGSVTRRLMVYNPNDAKVVVSSIRLAGGEGSPYRMNVSGDPAIAASDIEIAGHDSLFIFIRVTVNPNSLNLPFVVSDSIQFLTNGTSQQVKLVAWGMNAHFYKYQKIGTNTTWDSLKAHVIYGSLEVVNNATLVIQPGTKVYFHKGSYLEMGPGSTLKVEGTLNHRVHFQGDRLDPFYRDLPGQWAGIFIQAGSKDHQINYAVIKNGVTGLYVDSLGSASSPMLTLDNTIIQNMTSDGLVAFESSIRSTNCVFGNCGGAAVNILAGGEYDFRQLTIGNYWNSSVRSIPSLILSNYYWDELGNKIPVPLRSAYFGNAVIYGTELSEVGYDSLAGTPFNVTFDHSLLAIETYSGNLSRYIGCIFNKDPKFLNPAQYDYRPDSLSPLRGVGIPLGILFDINGTARTDTPDLGAYQYVRPE